MTIRELRRPASSPSASFQQDERSHNKSLSEDGGWVSLSNALAPVRSGRKPRSAAGAGLCPAGGTPRHRRPDVGSHRRRRPRLNGGSVRKEGLTGEPRVPPVLLGEEAGRTRTTGP